MCSDTAWYTAPSPVMITRDEVHVWRATLDLPATQCEYLRQTLSTDEIERAERFFFERDRTHFIAARGVLRSILGQYVEIAPQQLRFTYSSYGKPALEHLEGQIDVRFNVSHSHGLALYAIACGRDVGVDLERIRPEVAGEEIAARFFAPQEYTALCAIPATARQQAFFTCWTRKEAYIKARGEGLSHALDQFAVSLTAYAPVTITTTGTATQDVARWSLQDLWPDPHYAAALAVEGHNWRLRCWQWHSI